MLLQTQTSPFSYYPTTLAEQRNLQNKDFIQYRDRIINEHHRTQNLIECQRERVLIALKESKELREACLTLQHNYDSTICRINSSFQEMNLEETNRLQEQEFIDKCNAGKPVGFFQLPSMMMRAVRLRQSAAKSVDRSCQGVKELNRLEEDEVDKKKFSLLQILCNLRQTIDKQRLGLVITPEEVTDMWDCHQIQPRKTRFRKQLK